MSRILDARPRRGATHRRPLAGRALLVSMLTSLVVGLLPAQLPPAPLPLSNTEDARTLPKGVLRFGALNAWTRFDNVFGVLGDSLHAAQPLGTLFSVENLGTREIPSLSTAEGALRTLTGDATVRLGVGRLVATADSRVVTTPLALEYGLSNRLTIGVMVPVVQTHSTVFVELNPRALSSSANVGPNPALAGLSSARTQNAALLDALQNAQADLDAFVQSCNANPGSCSSQTIARATAALARATLYESAVSTLYGATTEGSAFVPLGNSTAQAAVAASLASLQSDVDAVLGPKYRFGEPAPANGRAALLQLQQVAMDPAGIAFDSLGSPDRIGIGDVELSAAYRLLDGFGDTLRRGGLRARAAVRGVLRLGTGRPSTGRVPFEIGTGTGQTSADVAGILDLRFLPRVLTTLAAQYTAYFGTAAVARMPGDEFGIFPLGPPIAGRWRAGNVMQVEATPRLLITDYFTVHGHYVLRREGASSFISPDISSAPLFDATTEQRVGGGFAYSTLARYARGKTSVPIELLFSTLQTLTARGGLTPQYTRTQIELRIFYRLRRGAR